MSGTRLSPWEAQALHTLSAHYAAAANAAREPACRPVWPPAEDPRLAEQRKAFRTSLKAALRGVAHG